MQQQGAERARRMQAWDGFLAVSRPDVGYKQASWWIDFLVGRGWGHFGAVFRDGDAVLGGAQVMIRRFAPGTCFYYIPHGPVLPEDEADAEQMFRALMAYADKKRTQEPDVVSHLRLEPRWACRPKFVAGFREATNWHEPRDTLCIDLSLSEAALLSQMKPKGRYNIGVARRKGVTVAEDRSANGLAEFVDMYNETFERHGLGRHSPAYFRELVERLRANDCGTILFAAYRGLRLATALILYCGDWATYKYGGSRLEHRDVMAPYLLQFEAMLTAKARGHRWYDFYGIARTDRPDDPWAGFSTFKRKFGGREVGFGPALDYVFDEAAYAQYRRRRSD